MTIFATYTPLKRGAERTAAIVEGVSYVGVSRHGSGHALARALVGSRISDDVLIVQDRNGVELYRFNSFHGAAQYTVRETALGEALRKWTPGPPAREVEEDED